MPSSKPHIYPKHLYDEDRKIHLVLIKKLRNAFIFYQINIKKYILSSLCNNYNYNKFNFGMMINCD